mmetsp:Transcript_74366/g.164239  ORF Transcript_74366/g.164239 Transcript_74366/m.164239 type:complete len:213 (-) Transcript_74366:448-1086(-)
MTQQGHATWISSEGLNVSLNPLQSQTLIHGFVVSHSTIPCLLGQVFMCPMSQEAAAVAHADEERLVADYKSCRVVPTSLKPIRPSEAAWDQKHEDRSKLCCRSMWCIDMQLQAIFADVLISSKHWDVGTKHGELGVVVLRDFHSRPFGFGHRWFEAFRFLTVWKAPESSHQLLGLLAIGPLQRDGPQQRLGSAARSVEDLRVHLMPTVPSRR